MAYLLQKQRDMRDNQVDVLADIDCEFTCEFICKFFTLKPPCACVTISQADTYPKYQH